MSLDDVDRAIISHLVEDGRLSNVALADRVHLTPGPCLRRVQRLESTGVILGYQAVVDPAAIGLGFEVILEVDLTTFDHETVDRFETSMVGFDEVVEFYRLFGSPDYFLRIVVADLDAYEAFLTQRVMTIPGIAKVSSRFAMKVLKALRPGSAPATGGVGRR